MNNLLRHICIQKATQIFKHSNVKRAKVSAIAISRGGKIIAFTTNRRIYGDKHRFTQHAEERLIIKLQKIKAFQRFGKITILVIRFNSRGIAMAKPCLDCQRILSQYNTEVFYTANDGLIKRLRMSN